MRNGAMSVGVLSALVAALLFGASTPLAKLLVGQIPPALLAGLLYLGSGVGLGILLLGRLLARADARESWAWPSTEDWKWLLGATATGGVIGPLLLLWGLTSTPASTASLLLNMEGVFTALLAWYVFHENFDRRIALGIALIVAGGAVLVWQPGEGWGLSFAALAIIGACAAWALDNNLTRKVAANDALLIACVKGLVAGATNVGVGVAAGGGVPAVAPLLGALVVGFAGYGVSLVLFVIGLRHLGTARTGAYFSVAPFFGAVLALGINAEPLTASLAAAGILMGLGVWLHLTERHAHEHVHEPLTHTHRHHHDEHHQHEHAAGEEGPEPHVHAHVHEPLRHAHPHYPDIHHRHDHRT